MGYVTEFLVQRVLQDKPDPDLMLSSCSFPTAKKQSIKGHLTSTKHQDNYQEFLAEGGARANEPKNREALRHLLDEVLMNLSQRIPFTQFCSRVALNVKHGIEMGFQNHSAAFPAQVIDTMYEVMTEPPC